MHTFALRFFPNTGSLSDFLSEAKHTSSSLRSSLIASHLHEVHRCIFGSFATSGHPCTKLNWRLADTSTIGRVHSLASKCHSCSLEVLGVEVEPQENCSVSESDCDFSRGGLGFDHNVGTSVSCIGGVDPDHCGKSEARPGDVCPSMPNTTGSYGCSRRYTVRFAAHEALSVVAQEQKSTHNFQFFLGWSVTPDPRFWSCGSGPWGALDCRFWSRYRDCWNYLKY